MSEEAYGHILKQLGFQSIEEYESLTEKERRCPCNPHAVLPSSLIHFTA